MRYRRKSVVVEARRFTGEFDRAMIVDWMGLPATAYTANGVDLPRLAIPTGDGRLDVMPGDWIVESAPGQFFPFKPEAFAATYEQVGEE
jgi:hypothetical protein